MIERSATRMPQLEAYRSSVAIERSIADRVPGPRSGNLYLEADELPDIGDP